MASTRFERPVGSNQLLRSDLVDNLSTNDATKALTAKQGKILNDHIDIVEKNYSGTTNASGNLALTETPSQYVVLYASYYNDNGTYYGAYPLVDPSMSTNYLHFQKWSDGTPANSISVSGKVLMRKR